MNEREYRLINLILDAIWDCNNQIPNYINSDVQSTVSSARSLLKEIYMDDSQK